MDVKPTLPGEGVRRGSPVQPNDFFARLNNRETLGLVGAIGDYPEQNLSRLCLVFRLRFVGRLRGCPGTRVSSQSRPDGHLFLFKQPSRDRAGTFAI